MYFPYPWPIYQYGGCPHCNVCPCCGRPRYSQPYWSIRPTTTGTITWSNSAAGANQVDSCQCPPNTTGGATG